MSIIRPPRWNLQRTEISSQDKLWTQISMQKISDQYLSRKKNHALDDYLRLHVLQWTT